MESSVTPPSQTVTLAHCADRSVPSSASEVRVEISSADTQPPPASLPCPRCGGRLTNPEGLGWCPGCGYCRSLEADGDKAALGAPSAPSGPSTLGIVEFVEVLAWLPGWLWVLLGGITIVAVISAAADCVLPPDDSLARALWSTIQLVTGLVGLLAAQVWAFLTIAPESDRLSAKDLILSARLWSMTCRCLPLSQRQVWLGGWSAATALSAIFLIGGFSYWYQFYRPKKIADAGLIEAIAEAAKKQGKNKSLEESIDEFAGSQNPSKKKDEAMKNQEDEQDKRPTQQCVILGYIVENDKEQRKQLVTSLVLATVRDGRLQYAGIVRRGFNPLASDELLKRLAPLVQPEPFLAGLSLKAIWVKPQLFCEVHQSGFDRDGRLLNPRFKDLLDEQ